MEFCGNAFLAEVVNVSTTVIVDRRITPGACISIDKWVSLITSDKELRIRISPYLAINPKSGERLQNPVGIGDSDSLRSSVLVGRPQKLRIGRDL
jgi:hypothetical protein